MLQTVTQNWHSQYQMPNILALSDVAMAVVTSNTSSSNQYILHELQPKSVVTATSVDQSVQISICD